MMDILKRIDQAQQFCKFYADGAYSVETAQWNHHVNPEFIEDIRQYIESLQLKLMHLQTQQAHRAVCKSESYDMLDRFLRNNLYDDDYESYSEALEEIASTPPQRKPLTDEQIDQMWSDAHNDTSALSLVKVFARAIEAKHGIKDNT
jgi:two-component SAPR family response regulator